MTNTVDTSKEAVERFAEWAERGLDQDAADLLRALLAERDQLRREMEEALKSADKLGYHCVGCGHLCGNPVKDLEILRKSGARSCCPEREMEPLSETIRALKTRP